MHQHVYAERRIPMVVNDKILREREGEREREIGREGVVSNILAIGDVRGLI